MHVHIVDIEWLCEFDNLVLVEIDFKRGEKRNGVLLIEPE